MRVPRPYSKLWVRGSTLRGARYSEIIDANHGIFDEGYFKDVDKQRASAASLRLILVAIQIPIFAVFALALIPVGSDSHALGIVRASRDLREILIVVSAVLGVAINFIGYHHDVLAEIMAVRLARRSKDDKDVQELLNISYGMALFPFPPTTQGDLELGGGYRFLVRALSVFTWLTLVILALGAIFIRVKVLEDIYFVPTFSGDASGWVIGFAVITDLLGGFILILNAGPLRARKYQR